MIPTNGLLTALERTKFVFAGGLPSAQDPAIQLSPDPLADLRDLLLRGGEGRREEANHRCKGGRGRGKGRKGRKVENPIHQFLHTLLAIRAM